MEVAFFAGGCFWGIEAAFQQIPGIKSTRVGYMGGHTNEPTYQDVCSDKTGHAETVAIEFDETIVSYQSLLKHFFSMHNPTEIDRQGPDIGSQYRSVVFYTTNEQKEQAEKFIADINLSDRYNVPVATEVIPASTFWPAEDYHQSYFMKIGQRYGRSLF
ncbi:peptide-methionine (S)-S-oxide reductase MsrA [Methanospirillum sp. J.3.6.1-F.2.7.3]|jgi:peptide-methionine (S)-S-oxide reductase|uniref:Peptide methionine sulfoxide reductase MsrA n=2 Tax=Methanospirillum TaxID=2202 RepID=A0A8E7AUD0_9EURY|nr:MULTISPECIES: peptide-methionine (S)-S-oxide reductase MsrA [Methanospirillum]MDX8551177.1 peptide-methionine (S)-S-oxide reductase MsrA [Methanospirillum hungatei]NLW76925.1 peptide-methionine (S)-S-oxide reductase MsrA [Methanomicrobiales archaeon]QVV87712.1 peptide-methionine (S)-S-oxide reductase MsrA [Methanospirillum sp. J.3.6.1-F.2.7.3]QXO95267.1 peptide-methionine (S)-S-oxide reductase MsrA [Methanospirillum hungatei]